MTPTTSRHWVLSRKPTGPPILSGANATFELVTKPLPQLQEGEVLVQVQYLSNDPALRLWIDPNIAADRLYTRPVEVGETVAAYSAVSEVIESRAEYLPIGSLVFARTGWCEYAVIPAVECAPVKHVQGLAPASSSALLGVTGVTAYYGLVDIVHAGPNDAVVISGAAGSVGSAAVQIAKNLLGCRKVIGIAGTDAKCKWVESLGADVCLNYKSSTFETELQEATKGFVEVFFDNTGGKILDIMLTLLKKDGRVAACGAIAGYNDRTLIGIKNWYHVIAMRLQLRGFVVLDAIPTGRWAEITDILVRGFEEGKIKATEETVTIVPTKFEDIPKIWMSLFEGSGTGKLLSKLV